MRVRVYRNIRRKDYSIMAMEGPHKGKVLAHEKTIVLLQPIRFVVSESGRQRVLKTGCKNVHAFVEGCYATSLPGATDPDPTKWRIARYNPRKAPTFVYEDGSVVTDVGHGHGVILSDAGVLIPKGS